MDTQDLTVLDALRAELAEVTVMVREIHDELRRYTPILEAYLAPDSTGPGAWAARRQLRKARPNGDSP